jgi:hypothetical protein
MTDPPGASQPGEELKQAGYEVAPVSKIAISAAVPVYGGNDENK